jgi:hypothetical protein
MKKQPVYDDRVFPAKVFLEAYGEVRDPTAQSSPKTLKPCGRWKRTWTSRFTSGQARHLLEDVETHALNDAVAKGYWTASSDGGIRRFRAYHRRAAGLNQPISA